MKESSLLQESRLRTLLSRAASSAAIGQASWVTGIFVVVQVLRLGTNILLAHLLSPVIFGVMALINALRVGVELLTDVGVGQNIVVNKRGDEPAFYNTAWTVQLLRGVGLTAVGMLAAWPLAWAYDRPALFPILMVCSAIFFLSGVQTPARFLMQRRRDVRNLSALDAFHQVIGLVVSVGFAFAMPTVWGMVWALVVHAVICAVISFKLMDVRTLSLRLDREHLSAILHFGKWIFLSSLVYFAAMNFDRLYLPVHIPLALFGVYGIAKSMSDLASQFMQRIGGAIVFPAVARESGSLRERMSRIVKLRSGGLALVSAALGGGIAVSDLFVILAYDARYAAAALLLPMLLLGAWFSVQAAISESVLLGLAQPSRAAMANLLKLLLMTAAVVFAFEHGNLFFVFLVLALSDAPRYFVLLAAQHRAGLRFGAHDLGLFLLMLLAVVVFRAPLVGLGLVDGFISSTQWADIQSMFAGVTG